VEFDRSLVDAAEIDVDACDPAVAVRPAHPQL
jgi:hypothetical protein